MNNKKEKIASGLIKHPKLANIPTSLIMNDTYQKKHKLMLGMAEDAKLGDLSVSLFMNTDHIKLTIENTVKGTIEIFRSHHISGAPVIDVQEKVIGVITEYDLLLQASSKQLSSPIDYQSQVISVYPETTLKEAIMILYKRKLKWMPVINQENYLQGVISRIDVLNFIATHSPNAR